MRSIDILDSIFETYLDDPEDEQILYQDDGVTATKTLSHRSFRKHGEGTKWQLALSGPRELDTPSYEDTLLWNSFTENGFIAVLNFKNGYRAAISTGVHKFWIGDDDLPVSINKLLSIYAGSQPYKFRAFLNKIGSATT